MLEEVLKDVLLTLRHAPMSCLNHLPDVAALLSTPGNGLNDLHDGVEYPRDLGVLVYECQGIGHIVVTQMHHTGSYPGANFLLRPLDNLVHGSADRGCRLDSVEALSSISQTVIVVGSQQVFLGKTPKFEHIILIKIMLSDNKDEQLIVFT